MLSLLKKKFGSTTAQSADSTASSTDAPAIKTETSPATSQIDQHYAASPAPQSESNTSAPEAENTTTVAKEKRRGLFAENTPAQTQAAAITSSWLQRLRSGLSKSSSRLSTGIGEIFSSKKLDAEALQELEDLLVTSDMGVETAKHLVSTLANSRFDKQVAPEEIRQILAEEIANILTPVAIPVDINENYSPYIILVVGVNGNGKTTTIGKMANLLMDGGWSVMLCAADTFRAAAVEQLQVWGERVGCGVVTGEPNADPASVAFRAVEEAKKAKADVLLIDTAGRLQNKKGLMEELQKVTRVIKKLDADAPHSVIQILDATTGQNAHSQINVFSEMVGVNGLVVTKLDGTAKGGVVVALAQKFGIPIHAIGVGEGIEDLKPFEAHDYANSLMDIERAN